MCVRVCVSHNKREYLKVLYTYYVYVDNYKHGYTPPPYWVEVSRK